MSTDGTVAGSAATTTTDHEGRAVPADLESAEAKLVYHSLDAAGPGDADELSRRLALRKTTLFGVLDALRRRDLVERDEGLYCPT